MTKMSKKPKEAVANDRRPQSNINGKLGRCGAGCQFTWHSLVPFVYGIRRDPPADN